MKNFSMLDCNAFIQCKYLKILPLKPETIIRLDLSNNKIDLEKVDF
jgi:hypothetical protein